MREHSTQRDADAAREPRHGGGQPAKGGHPTTGAKGGHLDPEQGQISILLIGMVAVALTIIMSVVSVTSVQLSRIHLLDAADAAALDASDALARELAYAGGIGSGVPVTDQTVRDEAAAHLAGRPLPGRLQGWTVGPGTGTPDGRTAVVTLAGTAHIPILTPVLGTLGGGVTITVTSSARSDLEP